MPLPLPTCPRFGAGKGYEKGTVKCRPPLPCLLLCLYSVLDPNCEVSETFCDFFYLGIAVRILTLLVYCDGKICHFGRGWRRSEGPERAETGYLASGMELALKKGEGTPQEVE